jgi:hypothetical protein
VSWAIVTSSNSTQPKTSAEQRHRGHGAQRLVRAGLVMEDVIHSLTDALPELRPVVDDDTLNNRQERRDCHVPPLVLEAHPEAGARAAADARAPAVTSPPDVTSAGHAV